MDNSDLYYDEFGHVCPGTTCRQNFQDYMIRGDKMGQKSLPNFILNTYKDVSQSGVVWGTSMLYQKGSWKEEWYHVMRLLDEEVVLYFSGGQFLSTNNAAMKLLYCVSILTLLHPWQDIIEGFATFEDEQFLTKESQGKYITKLLANI
jgi:hypothetical protein